METLYTVVTPISSAVNEVKQILEGRYQLNPQSLQQSLLTLSDYLSNIIDDVQVLIEHPYVDKTYRDSYYTYYASKRDDYARDTIKLSFFEKDFTEKKLNDINEYDNNQENFLGFLVVRPTFPFVIGRSLLKPTAFKGLDGIRICSVQYSSSVNGVQFKASGFPHSSQDQEVITCAETTVWSIMEYFGNKYAEYSPSLPSKANQILGRFSFERLVPSKGLTAAQISYALKELGFGVKIYSRAAYNNEFYQLLRTYIESGVPVVGLFGNAQGIGHAVNIIGRREISQDKVSQLNPMVVTSNNVEICDFADIDFDYIYVDDNKAPYRASSLFNPVASYTNNPQWTGCELMNFIAPLYSKVYLDAGEARKLSLSIIQQLSVIGNKRIITKTFLASSRSYKHSISLNADLQDDVKVLLVSSPMPKFIWVTEISTEEQLIKNEIEGLLILDATEPKRMSIVAALIDNRYLSFNINSIKEIQLTLQPFSNYKNNLKKYEYSKD